MGYAGTMPSVVDDLAPTPMNSTPDSLTRQRRLAWCGSALLGVMLLSMGGQAVLISWGASPEGAGIKVLSQLPTAALLVLLLLYFKKPADVRTSSFTAAWILVLVVIPAAVLFGPLVIESFHQEPFDAAAWQAQESHTTAESPPRLRMAADLVDSEQLLGLTRREVIDLLGYPDMGGPFETTGPPPNHPTIWYVLGPAPGPASYGDAWLGLALSPNGQVTRAFRRDER